MKKQIIMCCCWIVCSVSAFSQSAVYQVDTKQSTVHWHGYYVFSFGEHYGTINLKKGQLSATGDQLTGFFDIDMTSIRNLDMQHEEDGGKGFDDHLKSEDFFFTGKFPDARFEIVKTKKIPD